MTDERWLPAVGWEGLYEVSDEGRVRSLTRYVGGPFGSRRLLPGRIMTPWVVESGHLYVSLWKDSRGKNRPVHQLVLEAFVGPRPGRLDACHNDGIPTNNRPDNLRWDTRVENARDTVAHGKHPMSSQTECKRGHPFTPENTYAAGHAGRPGRKCRECTLVAQRIRDRARRAKLREQRGHQ